MRKVSLLLPVCYIKMVWPKTVKIEHLVCFYLKIGTDLAAQSDSNSTTTSYPEPHPVSVKEGKQKQRPSVAKATVQHVSMNATADEMSSLFSKLSEMYGRFVTTPHIQHFKWIWGLKVTDASSEVEVKNNDIVIKFPSIYHVDLSLCSRRAWSLFLAMSFWLGLSGRWIQRAVFSEKTAKNYLQHSTITAIDDWLMCYKVCVIQVFIWHLCLIIGIKLIV